MQDNKFRKYNGNIVARSMNSTVAHSIFEGLTVPGGIDGYEVICGDGATIWMEKDKFNKLYKDINKKTSVKETGSLTNHPSYYAHGGIECIDAMLASKGWYKTMIFCELNAFKYNWRAGKKDNILKETEKQLWYIRKEKELQDKNFIWIEKNNWKNHPVAILDEFTTISWIDGKRIEAKILTDGKDHFLISKKDFDDHYVKMKNHED